MFSATLATSLKALATLFWDLSPFLDSVAASTTFGIALATALILSF
jgi:hypothetical protein